MQDPTKLILWLHNALNASIVAWGLAMAVWGLRGGRAVWALVLFFAIPLVWVAVSLLRRHNKSRSHPTKVYFVISKFVWAAAWLPMFLFMLLYVSLAEPWPFSLRQGPDTDYAREVFDKQFGFTPPESVSDLYGRREWAGFGEHVHSIKFHFDDNAAIERIVDALSLQSVPPDAINSLSSFPGPSWWPEQDLLAALQEAYRHRLGSDPQVFVHLWVDRKNRVAYFQDIDVL